MRYHTSPVVMLGIGVRASCHAGPYYTYTPPPPGMVLLEVNQSVPESGRAHLVIIVWASLGSLTQIKTPRCAACLRQCGMHTTGCAKPRPGKVRSHLKLKGQSL